MIKRVVYLAVPLGILLFGGLIAVRSYFLSFPPAQTVIDKLIYSENTAAVPELTEFFLDDSGSMKGYFGDRYIQLLRILKSHIREYGDCRYHAFSDPERVIEGDIWKEVEDVRFYRRNNTHFDTVLGSVSKKVGAAQFFIIITDGIQDVSAIQDYSRIVDKGSDVLDADIFFQIVAVQLPFDGCKYPEGGTCIPYKGDSPLYCYIFSHQYDYGSGVYEKLKELNLPVEFLGFGIRSIKATVKKFSTPPKNPDGSRNIFKRFKDEIPVSYLVGAPGTGGTLLTDIALGVKGITVDIDGIEHKTPEYCGRCVSMNSEGPFASDSQPYVTVGNVKAGSSFHDKGEIVASYALFFKDWDMGSKTVACDLTLCNWLPFNPPEWVDTWSSDCDNSRDCYRGRTPHLSKIIKPLLARSVNKYTFGYAVIRN